MTASVVLSRQVIQRPGLVWLDTFRVAGPSRPFDRGSMSEIPRLWSMLKTVLPFEGQLPVRASYGVVWDADRDAGHFHYLAGVGVEPGCALPMGFTARDIPAATYAVFRINLDGSALHPQVKAAMATVWNEMIPVSGLTMADGPAFERYDGSFAPDRSGAVIDFHVPVLA